MDLVWGTIIAIVFFPLAASRLPPWGGFFIFDVALPVSVGFFHVPIITEVQFLSLLLDTFLQRSFQHKNTKYPYPLN